jgi:hypothetical protein
MQLNDSLDLVVRISGQQFVYRVPVGKDNTPLPGHSDRGLENLGHFVQREVGWRSSMQPKIWACAMSGQEGARGMSERSPRNATKPKEFSPSV